MMPRTEADIEAEIAAGHAAMAAVRDPIMRTCMTALQNGTSPDLVVEAIAATIGMVLAMMPLDEAEMTEVVEAIGARAVELVVGFRAAGGPQPGNLNRGH